MLFVSLPLELTTHRFRKGFVWIPSLPVVGSIHPSYGSFLALATRAPIQTPLRSETHHWRSPGLAKVRFGLELTLEVATNTIWKLTSKTTLKSFVRGKKHLAFLFVIANTTVWYINHPASEYRNHLYSTIRSVVFCICRNLRSHATSTFSAERFFDAAKSCCCHCWTGTHRHTAVAKVLRNGGVKEHQCVVNVVQISWGINPWLQQVSERFE